MTFGNASQRYPFRNLLRIGIQGIENHNQSLINVSQRILRPGMTPGKLKLFKFTVNGFAILYTILSAGKHINDPFRRRKHNLLFLFLSFPSAVAGSK